MNHRLFFASAVTIYSLAVGNAQADEALDTHWDDCRKTNTCRIEFDHLATQESDPFMFLGRVMDNEQARWRQFRRAIHEYPDVERCLVRTEWNRREPNLLLIDWDRTGTGRGAEVCLFRIARSLGNLERLQQWLVYHGFELSELHKYRGEDYVVRYETQPVSHMSAYWATERYRERNPSWIRALTGFDPLLRYEVVFRFSETNQVVEVSVVTATK
ncbi:hypothetical protein [Aliiroseovarius sp. YM-037]|uniref:hypothetical protein n=1 Tax=Aliiroseovarius sp. YM-037 TaxID=3341728 RepID=UPI003A806163